MSGVKTVPVLLPIPTEGPYSYRVPDGMEVAAGDLVQVPLGTREVAACVWDGPTDNVSSKKLRDIIKKFDCPSLSEEFRSFLTWVGNYTLSPPGMVLKMALRSPSALDPPAPQEGLRFTGQEPDRITSARKQVLDFSDHNLPWTRSGLAHAAGVTASVVTGLEKQGGMRNDDNLSSQQVADEVEDGIDGGSTKERRTCTHLDAGYELSVAC